MKGIGNKDANIERVKHDMYDLVQTTDFDHLFEKAFRVGHAQRLQRVGIKLGLRFSVFLAG